MNLFLVRLQGLCSNRSLKREKVEAVDDEAVLFEVIMAGAKSHNYTVESFTRDMQRIMDTEHDRPLVSGIESLLEPWMESTSFLADEDGGNLGDSNSPSIEYLRHIMNTEGNRAAIIGKVEPLLKTVRKRRYLGTSRFCPVCESRLREFLPFGDKLKPNRRCPVCGSLERHRSVWLFMHQKTNLFTPPRKRILHMAPEPCLASMLQDSQNIDYVSADLTGYPMIQTDLTQLCFPNEIFDAVYASHVLEHILDDRRAMREIYRTLKPGGWAILQVPRTKEKATYEDATITDSAKREQAFGQQNHVRVYGEDYYDRLRDAGFIAHREKLLLQTISSAARKLGIKSSEEISFCMKIP